MSSDWSAIPHRSRTFLVESEAVIGEREPWWYALKLAEEAGEAVAAFNRMTGLSRRAGTADELARELGDVIYCAAILAEKLMSRGFRELSRPGDRPGAGVG